MEIQKGVGFRIDSKGRKKDLMRLAKEGNFNKQMRDIALSFSIYDSFCG